MPWWLTSYLVGAALPVLAVVAFDGWRSGAAGNRPITDPDDLRAVALLGISWPLCLTALVVLAVAWAVARVASR